MATIGKKLASGQITDATLTSIYAAPAGTNTRASVLTLTNTGATGATIDIYYNDGTSRLFNTLTLPGGSGSRRIDYGLQRTFINAGESLWLQSSAAISFNYFLDGSEIEIASS